MTEEQGAPTAAIRTVPTELIETVASSRGQASYEIRRAGPMVYCTCRASLFGSGRPCKHMVARGFTEEYALCPACLSTVRVLACADCAAINEPPKPAQGCDGTLGVKDLSGSTVYARCGATRPCALHDPPPEGADEHAFAEWRDRAEPSIRAWWDALTDQQQIVAALEANDIDREIVYIAEKPWKWAAEAYARGRRESLADTA